MSNRREGTWCLGGKVWKVTKERAVPGGGAGASGCESKGGGRSGCRRASRVQAGQRLLLLVSASVRAMLCPELVAIGLCPRYALSGTVIA